jgi:hypothetical protein
MMVNRDLGSPSQCDGPDRLLMSPSGRERPAGCLEFLNCGSAPRTRVSPVERGRQCLVPKLENGLSHPAPEGGADLAAEGRELIGTFCVPPARIPRALPGTNPLWQLTRENACRSSSLFSDGPRSAPHRWSKCWPDYYVRKQLSL